MKQCNHEIGYIGITYWSGHVLTANGAAEYGYGRELDKYGFCPRCGMKLDRAFFKGLKDAYNKARKQRLQAGKDAIKAARKGR